MNTIRPIALIVVGIFTISFLLFALVPFALAAEQVGGGTFLPQGVVPCGTSKTPACQPCHIFVLGQNILNFLWWGLSIPIATLMLAYGGFLMMLPGGIGEVVTLGTGGEKSVKQINKGKKVLTNTLIGILIVFFAWLAIDTIIKVVAGQNLGSGATAKVLGPKGFGPWNKIPCEIKAPVAIPAQPLATPPPSRASVEVFEQQRGLCPTCVSLGNYPAKPGSCSGTASGQTCKVANTLNERLALLNKSLDKPLGYWWVTETFPPTVTHQNQCHDNGTCVDANLRGSYAGQPQEIANFIKKAGEAGLNAVYEIKDPAKKDALVGAGVPAQNILVVQQITGEHFSVYLK